MPEEQTNETPAAKFIMESAQRRMPLSVAMLKATPPFLYSLRFTPSLTMRSPQYECYWFYKSMSRCIDAHWEKEKHGSER
jgi:hypothetical protein